MTAANNVVMVPEFPEKEAILKKGGACVVQHSILGHLCGYVRFNKRPVIEKEYGGILSYVPVHGGITYAKESKNGSMVYGFDCAHCDDENNPNCKDANWVLKEAINMGLAILIAKKHERKYLAVDGFPKKRAKIIDCFHLETKKSGVVFDIQDNFGAMINLLSGQL
jgi:hypothetical protein